MKLPKRRYRIPRLVKEIECRNCGGDVLEVGETDWGSDDEGNVYGWLPDWECSRCGNYLSACEDSTKYKDTELEELYHPKEFYNDSEELE